MPTTDTTEKGLAAPITRHQAGWDSLAYVVERTGCVYSACGVYSVDAGGNLPILAA